MMTSDVDIDYGTIVADLDDVGIYETKAELESNVTSSTGNEVLEYDCSPVSDDDFDMLRSIDKFLNGYIGMTSFVVGIVINLICFVILVRPRLRKILFNQVSFVFYFFNLQVFDFGRD